MIRQGVVFPIFSFYIKIIAALLQLKYYINFIVLMIADYGELWYNKNKFLHMVT